MFEQNFAFFQVVFLFTCGNFTLMFTVFSIFWIGFFSKWFLQSIHCSLSSMVLRVPKSIHSLRQAGLARSLWLIVFLNFLGINFMINIIMSNMH